MTTAIAVYNSEGCVGRCDARCHNATDPACDCICGGRLHGVGAQNAVAQNTRDLLGDNTELLEEFANLHDLDVTQLRIEHGQGGLL